jgi:hypothetical protein
MPETTPETAVRNYLIFLTDPDSLVNTVEADRLREVLAESVDPIDRLMTMAALDRASAPDLESYEQAFITQAKEWAEAEDVPASAFETMGVPRHVLEAAGILPKPGRGRGRVGTATKAPHAPRKAMVKSDALEAGILALTEPFSVRDVSEKVGGSTITVTKAIERLEAQKKIVEASPRPNERGRASRTWTVAVEPL